MGYEEIDLERVLAVLQGWLHQVIDVQAENPAGPIHVLGVIGKLSADYGMVNPFIVEEEFDFAVGDTGNFTISGSLFLGASWDGQRLVVELGPRGNTILLSIQRHDAEQYVEHGHGESSDVPTDA